MSASGPAFRSKWQFLRATVLFGVSDRDGSLLGGATPEGTNFWVCFTDLAEAQRQLPPGYKLVQAPVRQMLPQVPDGTAIWVDPGTSKWLRIDPATVESLRRDVGSFPLTAKSAWGQFPESAATHSLAEALRQAASKAGWVTGLWMAAFQVEDAPQEGAVVYDAAASPESDESIVSTISDVLGQVLGDRSPAGLDGIQVLAISDLPESAASWLVDNVTNLAQQPG